MSAPIKAHVKPELLRWTRGRAKVKPEDAAKAAGVTVERLQGWEAGDDAPTLGQLRSLASKYQFPLAVFYLPEPPTDFAPLRDFRRLPDADQVRPDETISAHLAYHIRSAYERRELALELFEDMNARPEPFPLKVSVKDNPEAVGQAIREFLGVTDEEQKRAARQDRAFDFWRRRLEEHDVLVFVVSGPHRSVELSEMRGFAIARPELPVIVVNGKDYSQGGRAFTLLHELAHLLLGESAISNGASTEPGLSADERRVERFCDEVAAATLMPRGLLLSFEEVAPEGKREWDDEELRNIARAIGVSREALLIRFVTIGRASWDYYRAQRQRFLDEYRQRAEDRAKEKKSVPIKRPIMLMSWNGRGFTRLVLRSYYDQRITLNDVSSYLGAKVKHIPELERAVFQPAE
ncbi:MAG TPA: helix-turn-helix transcriptional regulator [Devosia sp.]|jgi:Zn-dependent peptidase ImmA (M78 family)|nr:helix-turn-helix transcriptional regulator [Devosia sp.]